LSFAHAETRLGELWRESTLEEPLTFEKGESDGVTRRGDS